MSEIRWSIAKLVAFFSVLSVCLPLVQKQGTLVSWYLNLHKRTRDEKQTEIPYLYFVKASDTLVWFLGQSFKSHPHIHEHVQLLINILLEIRTDIGWCRNSNTFSQGNVNWSWNNHQFHSIKHEIEKPLHELSYLILILLIIYVFDWLGKTFN